MAIEIYKKQVYGNKHYYLKDKESAKLWERISGKKTIASKDMKNLRKWLEVEFKEVICPE